jgi:hypothetical protein
MDTPENIEEFLTIIQCLNDNDLAVLHEALMIGEADNHQCLRKLRNNIINYPQIYNAYYVARVLINNPNNYIANEIVSRYKKQFSIY